MEQKYDYSKIAGIILIITAFIVNPFFVGFLFSPDNIIDTPITIVTIIGFEIFLLILGLYLYYKKKLLRKHYVFGTLILIIITTLLCFAALEVTILVLGDYDEDGQFIFGGIYLEPYVLPVNSIKKQINEFENISKPYAIPDPDLGWTIGNNTDSLRPYGYYQTNSIGVRSYKEFDIIKQDGTIRIAMFGDSFIHSYDVSMNETLAFYLEKELKIKTGTEVEVMNFGVGAYGIDQAYLRWKLLGKYYNPDIVIIGFQAENCKRNANIIRKFYFRNTAMPFSKPKFIIKNDSLELVNYPTINYKDVPSIVENFNYEEISEYEYYYDASDYNSNNPIFYSKLIRYLLTRIHEYQDKKQDKLNYLEGAEIRELCYSIIEQFYDEASADSEVYILHLPTSQDLPLKMKNKDFVYEELLLQLKKDFNVIDPTSNLLSEAEEKGMQSLFVGHYSPRGNEIVANSTAEVIFNSLENN